MTTFEAIEPYETIPEYEDRVKNFLQTEHLTVLLIFLGLVFISQIWYTGLVKLIGLHNFTWWQIMLIALIGTLILYYIVIKVVNVPLISFI